MTMTQETHQITDEGEEVETKRTRYTGPVNLTEMGEEEIDVTTSGLGRGRPSIDLSQYEKTLSSNYAKNAKRPNEKKLAWTCQVNDEAVSTVKSRFNTAAANIGVGVTYGIEAMGNGQTKISIVAGKRAQGRGRKAKNAEATAK